MASDDVGPQGDPDAYDKPQSEVARHSRGTGGDAPAAGSIAEREAEARDEDELFSDSEQSPQEPPARPHTDP